MLYTGSMPVTRDDVARRAGVSVATVSYVLNGGPRGVSEEKRRRVLAAIAELGYRPNLIARSLRARRTHILGLVLPSTANPYFAALSHAIEEAAAARGYQMVVANAADDPARETAQLEAVLRLQIDGLIWIPADVRRARRAAPAAPPLPPVPTILVDRPLAEPLPAPLGFVGVDNMAGGRLAVEHLLALGHQRIACLAGPADHIHARARLAGFKQALRERRIALHKEYILHGDFDYASGARHAARWCALPAAERPTAIVCGNDVMAIGALHAIQQAGLRVPQDLSVVGYDDVPQAAYTVPPLTTVAQPCAAIAAAAVGWLLERIEAPLPSPAGGPPASRLLPVQLVVRGSTAPPRSE